MIQAKRTEPIVPVGHPKFVWYGAADTDVQRTWRRFGWTPIHTTVEEAAPAPARRVIRITRRPS